MSPPSVASSGAPDATQPRSHLPTQYQDTNNGLVFDIPNTAQISYTTASAFIKLLKIGATALRHDPFGNQLFAVIGCPLDKWLEIERSLGRSKFDCVVREFYNAGEKLGIIKLLPPFYHGAIVGQFTMIICKVLDHAGYRLGDPFPTGATLCVNEEGSRKEPAATWRPGTRIGPSKWPGLVLEVGFSEAMSILRRDAKWWLESSPTVELPDGSHKAAVQQVIIIKVDREAATLTMESWVLSIITGNRVASKEHPTTILTTSIHNGNATTEISGPATLGIRWDSLFDRTPGPGEGGIVLDTADLKLLANTFLRHIE